MEIKEFATEFQETVKQAVENGGCDYTHELATAILEYLQDNGEVNVPEICSFQKTRVRLTAYDYNDEAESLDLFYLIKADNLLGKINETRLLQGFSYLKSFYREAMNDTLLRSADVSNTDEIAEVGKLVQSTKGNISQLRLYILTDGMTDPTVVPETEDYPEEGLVIEYNVWDIQRIFQQHNIRAGKEKVEIDFPTDYNTEIQCLKMSDENPYIDAYMAIMPGITLAKIYRKYQQALLEKNVRTFLQFKGKVNKNIRKTLREEPDMFFSYNNGISTTASEIELTEREGALFITRLFDWQIVNGGQTTASIGASLTDRDVDLKKVFVPMKISVIRDEENSDTLVNAISVSANSQTAIKNSDFSSNEPYLVDLEKHSRAEWVPNGRNRPICKWYFERTRGQYLDQLAQLSGLSEKAFRIEYPKTQKITKMDVAKCEVLWNMQPYEVCRGLEKNYSNFVTAIKRTQPEVTPLYYHKLIAKCILFNTIDSIVRSKKLGGYKANMNAYIMSSLSYLSGKNLDMLYIWEKQRVQQQVVDKIEELISLVWSHIAQVNEDNAQATNVSAWTKRVECWNRLKIKLNDYDKFDDTLMMPETNDDGSRLNETQRSRIEEAESFDPRFWFSLANWAKTQNQLTPIDRKAAFNFGTMRSRNLGMKSLKQALYALKIVSKARELGFNE